MDGFLSKETKSDSQLHTFIDHSKSGESDETSLDFSCDTLPEKFGCFGDLECRKTINYQHNSNMNVKLSSDETRTQNFTTSMYIDSFTSALHVPIQEKIEVMLLLGGNLSPAGENGVAVAKSFTDEGKPRHYRTILNADVIENVDGRLMLTPVNYQTVAVKIGFEGDSCQCANLNQEVYPKAVYQQFSNGAFDVTDHQILYSLMQQSVFLSVSKASCL